jgi:ethanolamine permease
LESESQHVPGPPELKKTLGPLTLWGLGVGYVISGEYFGWNLGLPAGGSLGLLIAFLIITTMYVTFVFSYAELACAIPRAGGGFVYGIRGLGHFGGYLTGVAQVIEFVFAPPAIAMAVGANARIWMPDLDPRAVAIVCYLLFTLLNMWGVQQAATFELFVAVLAVGEILLFAGLVGPSASVAHFTANAWPHGWTGCFAALPFAVWFYLGIEGVANVAEEARNPQRDVAIGFGSAILTLVVLSSTVMISAIGVGGWERVVYEPGDLTTGPDGTVIVAADAATSDSPLPLALTQILTPNHPMSHLLIGIGGLGLIASLNGIILIAGRAIFEMGRIGFLPRLLGMASARTHTPVAALAANFCIGVTSILLADTNSLITLAALGAVTLYPLSMQTLINLRSSEPELPRPFRTPCYPVFPRIAQVLSLLVLTIMLCVNFDLRSPLTSVTVWYATVMVCAMSYYGVVLVSRSRK